MASIALLLYHLFIILNSWSLLIAPFVDASTSKVHIVYMGEKHPTQATHLDMLASVVGSKEAALSSLVYSYGHGFSGFTAKLTESEAQKISELPGVVHIIQNQMYSLQTSRSWDYLGLSALNSSTNLQHKAKMGDGIIIGVLDTGIWPESKVFNDEGIRSIPSRWKGYCKSGQLFNASNCNKKLIGAKWFIDGFLAATDEPFNTTESSDYLSARDVFGHGTSMASIAAGSFVANVSYKGLSQGVVRGGAPGAHLAIYKVCWRTATGGVGCSAADILKAFDEAIQDGVDLLSVSLGIDIPLFPAVDARDAVATGSFHAVIKGIPVICAGGNSGPAAYSVINTAPWILNVAAATIDRSFPTRLTLGNNESILGQSIFGGKETGFTGLVYPENPGPFPTTVGACESLSFNHTSVEGKVVLCFTAVNPRGWPATILSAVSAVTAAGGVGVIAATNPKGILIPSGDDFPCIVVDMYLGTSILSYIRSTRSPTVRISPSKTLLGKVIATKVPAFSSRGPSSIAPAILKPDIAAPGVSILAATSPMYPWGDGAYTIGSGTSAAAPHISAIVGLIKSIHPAWSPAAIRSAIVTTAWKTDPYGQPIFAEGNSLKVADPFDYGGGLVNPNRAAEPGLVYDMDISDYIHSLCAMGYNSSSISILVKRRTNCRSSKSSILDVNLPSITIPNLRKSVSLTRTVTNVGPVNSIYKAYIEPPIGIHVMVEPNILVFNSTEKRLTFKVTVSTSYHLNTGYYFGSLSWADGVHTVKSSISVRTQIVESYTDDN